MPDSLSQDERTGKLTTPLGADVLALARLNAVEALSELFEFTIEAVSNEANLDFSAALGLGATIKLKTIDNQDRYFNGVIAEARWSGGQHDQHRYVLTLRPWLWLLKLTSDCRIFSSMDAKQIIKQVFNDRGFSDFRDATTNTPPTLEYCVQFRETDFAFVSRLMEEYGIYYFFEHSDGKHMLVLADAKSSHKTVPGVDTLPYIAVGEGGRRQKQHVETWSRGRTVQSGRFVLNDYDYNKPSANLLANSDKPGGYAHDSMEMFDCPGDYDNTGDGTTLAKVKVEAAQSRDDRRTAMGHAPSLFPGALIPLSEHADGGQNHEYLITRAAHFLDAQSYRSGGVDGGRAYVGNYEFTPSDRQFRAPLATPKAEVIGVQSALVVGKQGEEIDVDELGRVCVQFYWDRKKTASRRVRVAQFWAGKNRGALFLPRIGDEVLVQYEDGDPDRPIVIGSVYNGANTVPMNLPDQKNSSGILTKSTKNSDGYNFLLFNDTAGSEVVKLRAQKDLMFKALNNEQRDIGANQTENIGGDETINVGGPKGGGNFTLNAFQTITLNVGPTGVPLTTVAMTTSSITLSMNMAGAPFNKVVIDPSGITLSSAMGLSTLAVQPSGVSIMAPTVNVTGMAAINIMAATVNVGATLQTPMLIAGAGLVSGMPLI